MGSEQDLIAAVRTGDIAKITNLITESPALVNAHADSGESAVLLATYYGQSAIADLLIERGATLSFFEATAAGRSEQVHDYLRADTTLVNAFSPDGFTALGLAAFFGHADLVDLLLAHGAEVNVVARNPLKVMPLHSSVASRHAGISRALIEHGADVNATQQDDYTPLHEAAQNGDIEMIKLLLAHGASTSARLAGGETPYDSASKAGYTEAAELIKTHG